MLARKAAGKLQQVERIVIYIYDGIWTRRFVPFWWSPRTAFGVKPLHKTVPRNKLP